MHWPEGILAMKHAFLAALLAGGSFVYAATPEIYDYVIVGSGPGGGPLASVQQDNQDRPT
jgi:hypothetical protein